MVRNLRQHYRDIFIEDAEKMCGLQLLLNFATPSPCPMSENYEYMAHILRCVARRQLATIIYQVSYSSLRSKEGLGANSNETRKKPTSFCWEICANEIHLNKATNVVLRNQDHGSLLAVVPSEIKLI